ncbi:hypothetical protein LAZ67_3005819 [Cordylochernes scorpioides]|uniref:Uncharacterized protein n=1 Tax=Cordylochernes scorpioides TaxID=51811 RepID=A0ABY6KBY6_9ARAC|nr:hypothetical protein LAZ67_3005819 [Cordylochernes scorpioides]
MSHIMRENGLEKMRGRSAMSWPDGVKIKLPKEKCTQAMNVVMKSSDFNSTESSNLLGSELKRSIYSLTSLIRHPKESNLSVVLKASHINFLPKMLKIAWLWRLRNLPPHPCPVHAQIGKDLGNMQAREGCQHFEEEGS